MSGFPFFLLSVPQSRDSGMSHCVQPSLVTTFLFCFVLFVVEERSKLTLLLQLENAIHQRLAGRWASGHVDIHGDDPVAASDDGVTVMIISTTVGAASHTDHPSGVGHLIVNLSEGRCHLVCQGTGDNHDVALSGRGTENDTQSVLVVTWRREVHHFDCAASQTESHGPQRSLSRPVRDLIQRRQGVLHRTFLLFLRREGDFATNAAGHRES